MERAMDQGRCARLAHTVFEEVGRALRVESCRRDGDPEFKIRPMSDGGIEMTFLVFVGEGEDEPPAAEVVRVTVRPQSIF